LQFRVKNNHANNDLNKTMLDILKTVVLNANWIQRTKSYTTKCANSSRHEKASTIARHWWWNDHWHWENLL